MPLAPVLRGQLIRANKDAVLLGDHGCQERIHSLLLMTLSPYFDTILERCQSKQIRLDGADSEVLKMICEYAYEGKISGLSQRNVEKVFRVADMYNIISIINECQLFLTKTSDDSLLEPNANAMQLDTPITNES